MGSIISVPRVAIWLAVIVALLAFLNFNWHKVDQKAESTTFDVVVGQMNERANGYRQQWLVNKQPDVLSVAKQTVHYDHNGWVKPINGNRVDCDWWLSLLYPNLGWGYVDTPKSILKSDGLVYQCQYQFENNKVLNLKLSDKKLSITVEK